MMRALLAKFAEGPGGASAGVPDGAALPLDAPSVFALWLFATEHWQQARQQSQPPPSVLSAHSIDINNLSDADADVTRQLVMSALARTELTDGATNDTQLVAEVFELLGLTRLVVTPHAVAHFGAALEHYRQSRARTAAAWSYIKQTVHHGDEPAGFK